MRSSRCDLRQDFRVAGSMGDLLSFMIFKVFRNLAALLAVVSVPALAGNSAEEAILGAYDAYGAGDPIKLAKHTKTLDGHVLAPWLDHWRLSVRPPGAPPAPARGYLSRQF